MSTKRLSIGQLAATSGCKVPTIRYYEGIGLLKPTPRTEGGHRTYGEEDAKRLMFIRRGREFGFSLEAIRSLLDLPTDRDRSCAEVDAIATDHLEETTAQIRSLAAIRDALIDLLEQCRRTTIVDCRVIDALTMDVSSHPSSSSHSNRHSP